MTVCGLRKKGNTGNLIVLSRASPLSQPRILKKLAERALYNMSVPPIHGLSVMVTEGLFGWASVLPFTVGHT